MQAVVPRFPAREQDARQALVVQGGAGGSLLVESRVAGPRSSLRECLSRFREHHSYCSGRRRAAVAYESQLEADRTEFLAKKYTETVKQEQGTTACAGLIPNISNTHTSTTNTPSHPTQQLVGTSSGKGGEQDSSSSSSYQQVKNCSISTPAAGTAAAEKIKAAGEGSHTNTDMTQSTICSKLANFSPTSTTKSFFTDTTSSTNLTHRHQQQQQLQTVTTEEATCSIIVKSEPNLNKSCSQQHKVSKNGSAQSSTPNTGSIRINSSVKSRVRRHSRELLKNLPLTQTLPMSSKDDSESDDLALTADDILNGKICGTPLLIPLEEGDETSLVTTPTLKSPPLVGGNGPKRSMSSKTPPVTTTPPASGDRRGGVSDQTLKKELDAFSKVLNLVERQEKAKEQRVSTTPFTQNLSPSSMSFTPGPASYQLGHLVSPPPPYSMSPLYPAATQQPHPSSYTHLQRHFSSPPTQYGGYSAPPPDTPSYVIETHPQSHPLQHLPSTTTLSQIGSLLSSPVTTHPSPQLPSFDFPSTPQYHHGNPMYGTGSQLYSGSPHPSGPPGGMIWNGTHPGNFNVPSAVAGQKRPPPTHNQYAPPTKITHSSQLMMSSTSCYPSSAASLQNTCPQFPPGTAPSFPHIT